MDDPWVSQALRLALLALVAAPLAAPIPLARRLKLPFWLVAAASALALAASIAVVASGDAVQFSLWSPAPYAELQLRLDPTGAFFAAIVAGVALAASVFGSSYAHHSALDDAVYPLFVLSMLLVVAAGNVYSFLIAWEAMALSSFILVIGDGTPRPRRQAAILYLLMTHVSSVFVFATFFLVARHAGSTSFEAMAADPLTGANASLAFVFALIGFGTKAGLMPLHIWLPRAHPVAPSHVSALMSAAMVKVGLYGLIRVSFSLLAPGETWWAVLLIAIGGLSAVMGVLYALMETEVKRILAFSTVENIGIITIALGAALAFRANGQDGLAAAALVAGLLHAANHGWFKTLLFLASGSIQNATHTLNLDRLGGLARRMPVTGAAVLVGSLAIAALPPFNGFVGEWLLMRSLVDLVSGDVGVTSSLAGLGALAALALTGGLAVACFVRLYGIAFLGVARSEAAERAKESARAMYLTLGLLALGCLVTGLAAPWLARGLSTVTSELTGATGISPAGKEVLRESGGSISPLVIAGVLALLAPLPWLLARAFWGAHQRERGAIWTTGVVFRPTMQYTAASFTKPVRLFFSGLLLPERTIAVSYHGASPLPRLISYTGRVPALFDERLYEPARVAAVWMAGRVRLLQAGSVQLYLLYIMATLVLLVVAVTR
ncbi:MAG TPA: proton-conducting transporter membrane subunit [Dehalococcoidia bacterium]|nr:proton-conducting transporter membrane subunit [Dehalococcoidia bacterium]